MEFVRFFWPAILGGLVALFLAFDLLGRPRGAEGGPRLRAFLARNGDGATLTAALGILLLLLAGSQISLARSYVQIQRLRHETGGRAAALRKSAQEWSLRCRTAEAERDSLLTRIELAAENARTATLRGRVVVRASGGSLAGATVHISRHDPTMHVRERPIAEGLVTGADGSFEASVPIPGPKGLLRVEVRAAGFPPARVWVTPDKIHETAVVRLGD